MTPAADWTRAGTRTVSGTTFVFGLEWRSPPGPETVKSAKAAVRETPGALAVVRRDRWQFALGPASARGAASAAAVLAERYDGTWAGVWPLPDGAAWWGLAVRHRAVYPVFGDVLLEDRDAARGWLHEHAGIVEWDLVIAPPDLVPGDLVEAERRGGCTLEFHELETLLARRRRTPVLADPARAWWRRILAAAAACVLAAGVILAVSGDWRGWLPAPAPERAERPPLPLPDGVPAPAVLDACLAALGHFAPGAVPPGWQAVSLGCQPGGGGVLAELALAAHEWTPLTLAARPGPAAGPALPETTLTHTAALAEPGPLPAAAPGTARAALARLAETLGGRAREQLAVERLEPSFDPETHTAPAWSELRWTLDTPAPVLAWRHGLDRLPAGRLEAMTFSVPAGRWRLSGRITVDPTLTGEEEHGS